MNKRGAISIFLIIIISVVLSTFLILFQYYSLALVNTDLDRSLHLVSKNILASYDDTLYNNYGILAYEKTTDKYIEKRLDYTFRNFSSPVNLYKIKEIHINYQTKDMTNHSILLDQILFFTKNKISLNLVKEIFSKIGKSNLYIEKTKEIQRKLEGNKGFEELKKIHKNLKSAQVSLDTFEESAYNYLKVIEIYEGSIEQLKSIEVDEEIKDLKKGIKGLESEYQRSYEKINLEYEKVKDIIELKEKIKRKKKQLSNLRSNESIETEEKLEDIRRLKKQIKSIDNRYDRSLSELIKFIEGSNKSISVSDRLKKLKDLIKETKSNLGFGEIKQMKNKNFRAELILTPDESLLINEYILGTFKSVASSDYRDFNFYLKDERISQSNAEVEYVIKGYKDALLSAAAVSKDILLIREGMNLAHLFIDPEKREFIFTTAEIPAIGFFTAAGMTGLWATGESSIDLFKIYRGNGTPFLKISDEHFVLDLETLLDASPINYQVLNQEQLMYYHDYLRLFLFYMKDDIKINRILDIIYTDYPIDNFILKHEITAEFILVNKLTGNKRKIRKEITGEYIYE